MKKYIILACLTCIGFTGIHAQTAAKSTPVLRHVVLFKFFDKSTPADVKKIEETFLALSGKIKLIKDLEWGVNNSPEKLNQGLTHCFFLSFSSEKDRDEYLVHPAHKDFVSIAGPHIDKVTVVDYWVHK